MNDIVERNRNSVATPGSNPFLDYGEQASQKSIVGKLLKFTKGDYFAGQEEEEVSHGTRFIANMDEMLVGWIRWEANKPTDQIMGKVSDGYQAPRRNELGDTDDAHWEVDDQGKKRDPWQFTNYLLLKDDEGDNELFTFTTSSKGGLSALGELSRTYGKALAQRPNEYPVIAIGSGSYPHSNKAYGRIKYPTFEITGWVSKDVFADDANVDIIPDEPAPKPKAADKLAKARI